MSTDHRGGRAISKNGQNPDRRLFWVGFKMVKHMVGANGQTLGRTFHGQRGFQMGPQTYQRGCRLLRDPRVRNGQKAGQTEKKRPSAPTVARCLTIFVMVKHLIEKTLIRCSTMFFVAVRQGQLARHMYVAWWPFDGKKPWPRYDGGSCALHDFSVLCPRMLSDL